MPPIFYLITSFLMAITTTSVQFLNFIAYFVSRNYFAGLMAVPHFVLTYVVETVSSDEADFHSWTFAHSVWWSWEWRSWNRRRSTLWQTAEWIYLHCSDASIHWVDELICGNHCITTDELCTTAFLSKGKESEIIEQLGCSKVFACWLPQMLRDLCRDTFLNLNQNDSQ